jgi:hypothetical protein
MGSHSGKNLPPGTFIPTSQRLMAIGQLCLAFSLMMWVMIQPYMGEYFALRSRMLLYEYAMGTSEIVKAKTGDAEKLERNGQWFKQLPEQEQLLLREDFQHLRHYAKRPTLRKIVDGITTLVRDIPHFEQAWIFFSITIAILLLLKVDGAKPATWILPLIVLVYAIDNQTTGKTPSLSPDLQLFPTEEDIIHDYLNAPLAPSLLDQKEQLEKGWKRYLIDNWSTKRYLDRYLQLEEAEFEFTIARLNLLHGQSRSEWLKPFHDKSNPLILFLYFIWNVLFAWIVSRRPVT